jgi:hypothetical protein
LVGEGGEPGTDSSRKKRKPVPGPFQARVSRWETRPIRPRFADLRKRRRCERMVDIGGTVDLRRSRGMTMAHHDVVLLPKRYAVADLQLAARLPRAMVGLALGPTGLAIDSRSPRVSFRFSFEP